ncbi:MAG: hypothetical protein IIV20_01860 [Bacteroidaceae bacterium]|nr:hypothetical protein [Bacteroidaceae bacterium]
MAAIAAPATVATIQKNLPTDSVRGEISFALLSAGIACCGNSLSACRKWPQRLSKIMLNLSGNNG